MDIIEKLEDEANWAIAENNHSTAKICQEAAAEIARVRAALAETQAENTRIRAALAQSQSPCVYCSLSKEDWAKCKDGFPGCARADDAMGCHELGASLKLGELEEKFHETERELWRIVPNTHFIPERDQFEGPGETWEAGYKRLTTELKAAGNLLSRLMFHTKDAQLYTEADAVLTKLKESGYVE